MSNERKYREEEVKEIFDLAVRSGDPVRPAVSDEDGLTLAEIQEALAWNALSLPGWARQREAQMEYIAGRVCAIIGERPREEDA